MCKQGQTVWFNIYNVKGELRRIDVDFCIAELVRGLNVMGFITVASCCGHGKRPGNIALADGREIIIAADFQTARKIDALYPPLHDDTDAECSQCGEYGRWSEELGKWVCPTGCWEKQPLENAVADVHFSSAPSNKGTVSK